MGHLNLIPFLLSLIAPGPLTWSSSSPFPGDDTFPSSEEVLSGSHAVFPQDGP